jgi:membrane-associated phospholipid phosphatase
MSERASYLPSASDTAAWTGEAARRLGTLCWLKCASTTLGITGFFMAYFWVMEHSLGRFTVMPLTALDRAISFRPDALPLYLSLWVYVSLPSALCANARELGSYALGCLALGLAGLSVFLLWPSAVPAFGIDWSVHPWMAFMKSVDEVGNACPSMHVAFAVFAAVWLQRQMRHMRVPRWLYLLSVFWCVGIVYSTIATRQHVALDAYAGIVLAILIAALHGRWLRGKAGAG